MGKKFITQDLLVESRNRDLSMYPNAYDYCLNIGTVARGVVSMNLSSAIVKKSFTTITPFNQHLDYQEVGGPVSSLTIPLGNYSEDSLCQEIEDLLNTATSFGWVYTVSRDPVSEMIVFSVSGSPGAQFSLLFNSGQNVYTSVHPNLGFPIRDCEYASVHTGSYHMDLEPSYIDIVVDEIPQFACKKVLRYTRNLSNFTGKPEMLETFVVARIPLDNENETRKYYTAAETNILQTLFKPKNFPTLTIRILDNFGKPYDPSEHSIVFQMVLLKDYLSIHEVEKKPPPPKKEYIVLVQPSKEIVQLKDEMTKNNEKLCRNIKLMMLLFMVSVVLIIALMFLKT